MNPHRSIPDAPPLPLDATLKRVEELLCEIRHLLTPVLARRSAALDDPAPLADPLVPVLRLDIGGARTGRRSAVRLNGVRIDLQDSVFILLLRFVVAHVRAPGAWSTRQDLGITKSEWMTSRVRRALKCAVPAGFELVESDGRARFRLNPAVVVDRDAAALAAHPDPTVEKLAAEWRS